MVEELSNPYPTSWNEFVHLAAQRGACWNQKTRIGKEANHLRVGKNNTSIYKHPLDYRR